MGYCKIEKFDYIRAIKYAVYTDENKKAEKSKFFVREKSLKKNTPTIAYVKNYSYLCIVGLRKQHRQLLETPNHSAMAIFATPTTPATHEVADNLRALLSKGAVRFTFFKKDGTIREAYGTRNLSVATRKTGVSVPAPYGKPNPNAFYDLEKSAWRSFIPENVASIDCAIA